MYFANDTNWYVLGIVLKTFSDFYLIGGGLVGGFRAVVLSFYSHGPH